ncbi:uncharacterized protein [Periplaneta americana]|uniref:uncharacterized protein isoform X3 n=1 Tax=Periplaneta americana TaxID=6978 RepID=UPI0037E8A67A
MTNARCYDIPSKGHYYSFHVGICFLLVIISAQLFPFSFEGDYVLFCHCKLLVFNMPKLKTKSWSHLWCCNPFGLEKHSSRVCKRKVTSSMCEKVPHLVVGDAICEYCRHKIPQSEIISEVVGTESEVGKSTSEEECLQTEAGNSTSEEYAPERRESVNHHFEESQFEQHRADGRKLLKCNSIPTIFKVPNPPKSPESTRRSPKVRKLFFGRTKKEESSGTQLNEEPVSDRPQISTIDEIAKLKLEDRKLKNRTLVQRKRDIHRDHIYTIRNIGLQTANDAGKPYLRLPRSSTSKHSIMPDSCCANGCTNRRVKGGNIQFFNFPFKDEDTLKKWVAAVGRRNFIPTRHSRICSEHFRKEDYLVRPNTNVPQLNSSAVPSIFHAHPKKATRKTRNRRKKLCDATSENIFITPQKKFDFGQVESGIRSEFIGISEFLQDHRLEGNENEYRKDPLSITSSRDDENRIKYETESSQILGLELNPAETMETDSITVKCEALEEIGVIIKEESESLDSYPNDDIQMPFPVVKCENVEAYLYADIVDISNIKQEAMEGQDQVVNEYLKDDGEGEENQV